MNEFRAHAYGWRRDDSDLDVRVVYFPDVQQALSVFWRASTKQHRHENVDFTEYPIQQYLRLLAKGNGNVLDNLFEEKLYEPNSQRTKRLQRIVLDGLHKGFLYHCLGYSSNLVKDMANTTRLARYGTSKLLLNRYKILLQGLILEEHRKVEYNLRRMHNYIQTDYCLKLLDSFVDNTKFDQIAMARTETDSLYVQLADATETSKLPDYHQSALDVTLDRWLINHYLKEETS